MYLPHTKWPEPFNSDGVHDWGARIPDRIFSIEVQRSDTALVTKGFPTYEGDRDKGITQGKEDREN